MFYIYALKSLRNNLWYIGLTLYPERRRRAHVRTRPDLYQNGHLFKILGRRKTAFAAGALERRLIEKYGTLWPGGNNMHPGGLTGHLLKFVRTFGEDAIAVTPKEGQLYSRKALRSAAKELAKGGHGATKRQALAASLMPQRVRDKIAIAAMDRSSQKELSLSPYSIWARKRKAWARREAGLPPLPGTEKYLLEPKKSERLMTPEILERMSRAQKLRIQKAKAERKYKPPWHGRQNRSLSQASKDQIALRAMHRFERSGKKLSYQGAWNRRKRFWQRHDKGLPPLPGTEHFLQEPRKPPIQPRSAASKAKQAQSLRIKYAKMRKAGKKITGPVAQPSPRTREQNDRLAAIKVKAGLVKGLHYDYRQILKCSAKAKKRANKGLRPIPGTECFIGLRTSPKKGHRWSWTQRARYREEMIIRVNAWLRQYAIDRGWIGANASRFH